MHGTYVNPFQTELRLLPDNRRKRHQARADLKTRAAGRVDVDGESRLAVVHEEVRDASEACERLEVAHGEHRRTLEHLDQLSGPLRIRARDVQEMAGPQRSVDGDSRDDDVVADDGAALGRSLE